MKNTKIITTLGPAVSGKDDLKKLLEAGSNVCRFNFSHGSHEDQGKRMQQVREVSKESGKP
jgi:pyruvate kinase